MKPFATWLAALDDANAPILGFQLPPADPVNNVTVREIAHLSCDGDHIRLLLSNRYGTTPITFAKVRVATSLQADSIDPSSDMEVTFGGATSLLLAPHSEMWSDDIAFHVAAGADVAVSIFVPDSGDAATEHRYAQ